MSFSEFTEIAKLAIAVFGGCLTIVIAIIANTFKVGKAMQGIAFELESLSKSVEEIKDTMHKDLMPKINGHNDRLVALEYHTKLKRNGDYV